MVAWPPVPRGSPQVAVGMLDLMTHAITGKEAAKVQATASWTAPEASGKPGSSMVRSAAHRQHARVRARRPRRTGPGEVAADEAQGLTTPSPAEPN